MATTSTQYPVPIALNTPADITMASRRLPLASVPNAVNSPIRAGVIGKRTRTQADDTTDLAHYQPPAKKQVVEANQQNVDPRRSFTLTLVDDQFPKRLPTQPTPLERKLAASREKRQHHPPQQKPPPSTTNDVAARQAKVAADNLESVRQWQRHYRRQFPAFVFYLDGVSDDIRAKCNKHIRALGAREEKFFSKAVTHVVTTRQISGDVSQTHANDAVPSSKTVTATGNANNAKPHDQRKSTTMIESTLQKRSHPETHHLDAEAKRVASQSADILTRARELGIKIWALEKLSRVLKTMFEADTGEQGPSIELRPVLDDAADRTAVKQSARATKDADLEQLLRNEKVNGPADRDITAKNQDMLSLKGCYIYIHDMDEKTRPVMVRDYPKPAHKTEGKWPQFHMTAQGRCPFVEDLSYTKQQQQQDAANQRAKAQRDLANQRRTRAAGVTEVQEVQPLAERNANLRRSPRKSAAISVQTTKPLDPPKLPIARQISQEEVPLFANIQTSSRGGPRMIGGMPVASGMQHSNVTSAIRSQIVSSTAISSTAPGMSRRLTESKEITALKRKVLERGASAQSQPPSSYINDMRAAINDESAAPPPRAAKRKAQESILGVVHEDTETVRGSKQNRSVVKKRKSEKDPKPGYCENCRDKFDDFDEHIASRKHQKFARAADNFKDLDALLAQLRRPHKAC